MPTNLLRQPNFVVLLILAWLVVAFALLLQHWPRTAETLFDTDDAMRLVQLRAWLEGSGLLSGWFDLHHTRLQPPLGIELHWSRLIDVGLAGLLLFFEAFVDHFNAERLMRAWWPLLWLLPTMAGTAAVAWRIAGREAAMVALLLAMVGVPAYQQFAPGRIDHHNVQIALTLLIVAATVWSDRKRWTAIAAGVLSGFALAIGFESLPYLAACGVAFAARYVVDREAAPALRAYGLSLAISTAVAFGISVAPMHWTRNLCDAIAINSAVATVCGGLVLALSGWLACEHRLTRALAVISAGSAAATVLLLFEPRCAGGPLAMVDPAIWPIWLSDVREMQPLLGVWRKTPLIAAAMYAFPALALLATAILAREGDLRRDFGFVTGALAFIFAAAVTIAVIRSFSYAMWLGMPLVATLALRLFVVLRLKSTLARVAAVFALTPLALSSGAITIAVAIGLNNDASFDRPEPCRATANYAPLADLEPGLIVTEINYGPFLLALTPHSVMAVPYHRFSAGIVTAHRALAAPPKQARGILLRANATYVLICGLRPPDGLQEPARSRSLWGHLQAGAVPDWLETVQVSPIFAVYRVTRP